MDGKPEYLSDNLGEEEVGGGEDGDQEGEEEEEQPEPEEEEEGGEHLALLGVGGADSLEHRLHT